MSFPYGLQPATSGHANQELLPNCPPFYSELSSVWFVH